MADGLQWTVAPVAEMCQAAADLGALDAVARVLDTPLTADEMAASRVGRVRPWDGTNDRPPVKNAVLNARRWPPGSPRLGARGGHGHGWLPKTGRRYQLRAAVYTTLGLAR